MKAIFIFMLAACSLDLQAQISPEQVRATIIKVSDSVKKFCDSAGSITALAHEDQQIVSDQTYKRYIESYFSYLSYNRGILPTGNSAALELSNNSTQLNLGLAQKFGNALSGKGILILTEGVKAKLNDGISQLFSAGNINTGTTLFVNFAFLPAAARSRTVTNEFENGIPVPSAYQKMLQKRKAFREAFCQTSGAYKAKYTALLDCLDAVNMQIRIHAAGCDLVELNHKKEAIEKELADAGLTVSDARKITAALQQSYTEGIYAIESADDAKLWVKFFWWSGGITYTKEAYDTYDENRTLAKRFGSQDFDAVGVNLAAQWFTQYFNEPRLFGSTYFNIAGSITSTNSYLNIKNQDILRSILRSSPDTIYSLQSSKNAKNITGKSYKTGWQQSLGTTFTGMFGEKQRAGINTRFTGAFSKLSSPVFSIHTGALLRLKNNAEGDKKSNATVNLEVFVEFNDLTDTGATGKSAWQNKSIGISTTVPFSKIFFK